MEVVDTQLVEDEGNGGISAEDGGWQWGGSPGRGGVADVVPPSGAAEAAKEAMGRGDNQDRLKEEGEGVVEEGIDIAVEGGIRREIVKVSRHRSRRGHRQGDRKGVTVAAWERQRGGGGFN